VFFIFRREEEKTTQVYRAIGVRLM